MNERMNDIDMKLSFHSQSRVVLSHSSPVGSVCVCVSVLLCFCVCECTCVCVTLPCVNGVRGATAAAESSIVLAAHTHCRIHDPTHRPLSET